MVGQGTRARGLALSPSLALLVLGNILTSLDLSVLHYIAKGGNIEFHRTKYKFLGSQPCMPAGSDSSGMGSRKCQKLRQVNLALSQT